MSTTAHAGQHQPAPAKTRRRILHVALWGLQVLLASQFLPAGLVKLNGTPDMIDMFAAIGVGQWLRYVVGALELAGAIGLLIPRLCGPAALGLAWVMVGATATNLLALGEGPWLPLGLLIASFLVARGRRPRTWSRASEPIPSGDLPPSESRMIRRSRHESLREQTRPWIPMG
jgi:putative oxidoreductase